MNINDFIKLLTSYNVELQTLYGDLVAYEKWHTGGMTGGSCWGGEPHPYTSDEKEPDFKAIDDVIEYLKPDISFMKYKGIMRDIDKIVNYDINEYGEYYGNSSIYKTKYVNVDRLYEIFTEHGLI